MGKRWMKRICIDCGKICSGLRCKKCKSKRQGQMLKGKSLTAKHKKKISDSAKKSNTGKWMKGRHLSEETKKKISKSLEGNKNSLGCHLSLDRRRKVSEAQKGNKNMLGKHPSLETKKRMSESSKGSKCNLWKGGITVLSTQIRNCFEYKQWRSDVFQRDNWTCQTCNTRSQKGNGVYLEAHHIKLFSKIIEDNHITTFEDAQKCKELWDIDNGITLCRECHKLTKRKE